MSECLPVALVLLAIAAALAVGFVAGALTLSLVTQPRHAAGRTGRHRA